MSRYRGNYYALKNLTASTCQQNLVGSDLTPFLKTGTTKALFQSSGSGGGRWGLEGLEPPQLSEERGRAPPPQ